jgi:cell division septum initiation protein DivIVA
MGDKKEIKRLELENEELRATVEKARNARTNVSHALNLVAQIREGCNIPASELWDACEYLEKALSNLPRKP